MIEQFLTDMLARMVWYHIEQAIKNNRFKCCIICLDELAPIVQSKGICNYCFMGLQRIFPCPDKSHAKNL